MKIAMMFILVLLYSCSNPHTPAGTEGYVFEQPRVWGKGGFRQALIGPANFGASPWRNRVISIDMRPQSYTENFKILALDKVNMSLEAAAVISITKGTVKKVVEDYGKEWYNRKIKKVFRNLVRARVTPFRSGELKSQRAAIQAGVLEDLTTYLKGTPFKLERLVVGNIDFPDKIVNEIENRVAKEEKEKAKDIEKRIAGKDAEIRIVEAEGIKKAQTIINSSLTDKYLQYEAIKAQMQMANSKNHTTIYIPVGANGVPLVRTAQ